MKKSISILLIFLVCLSVEAQNKKNKVSDDVYATKDEKPSIDGQTQVTNNFLIEENEILWQKVYQTTMTFDQLLEKVKDSGLFEKMEFNDKKISGDLKSLDADFKGAGFSEMSTAIYISRSHFTGFSIIDFQEGKYRVTFKKIVLSQKYDDVLTEQGEKTNIEFYGLKKGSQMRDSFKKNPSLILDYTLSSKFDFKDKQKTDVW